MSNHDEAAAWAVLSRTPGLNVRLLARALRELEGAARRLLTVPVGKLASFGFPREAVEYLHSERSKLTPAERAWLAAPRHTVLPFVHPEFPGRLKCLSDCPPVLFVAGNVRALAEPQLAIVGSRSATPPAIRIAFDFAYSLAMKGMTITSGMAYGIDTSAHEGALRASGSTIAVLGTGVDVVYPSDFRELAASIEARGALVSEFAIGAKPRRSNFPRRNRLIAGLALGTLVVEAAASSGSLITARSAADQGNEVFAIPGSIYNPLSRGCHILIKEGAKLTESVDDILKELNFSEYFGLTQRTAGAAPAADDLPAGMDKDKKILLDAVGFEPVHIDELVERTGLKVQAVSSKMLFLELEGHVQAAPGGRYSRVNRSRGER